VNITTAVVRLPPNVQHVGAGTFRPGRPGRAAPCRVAESEI
jgi:hypothetical protein